MNLSVGAKTDPGRRPNNEDQLLVLDVRRHGLRADGVLVIADGMGGRNFGERASATAVEAVGATLTEMLDADREPGVDVGDALDSALRKANARVYELSSQDEQSKGMGTTCVAVVVEGDQVHVAHVGDSRAYRWRGGQLEQLTDDHSYVAEQVRAGALTEENARTSRFRNVITRAVGIEPTITPDVSQHDLQGGDALLLCTDGLTNMVPEEEIGQILGQATSAQDAADHLVHLANRNGGRDNITAIVARIEVGNRTQRMRAQELQAVVRPDEADTLPEDETPTVQPMRRPRRSRAAAIGLWFFGLLSALSLTAAIYLGQRLVQGGYHFQTDPPFVVKPPPPLPPRPPDLAHVTYSAPTLLAFTPVTGDVLGRNPLDGSLTTVALSGSVLVLSPDGGILYKYPMPARHQTPAIPPPSGPGQRLHTATDSQGNFYLADTVLRSIEKYSHNGEFLRSVAQGQLKQPQALAVGDDGTVYVVDAQRLKVIHAQSAAPK